MFQYHYGAQRHNFGRTPYRSAGVLPTAPAPCPLEPALEPPLEPKWRPSIDPLGHRIWELVDGRRCIRDIAATVSDEYEIDYSTAELCVATFLESLVDRHVISWAAS